MFGRWFWILCALSIGTLFALAILRVVCAIELTLCVMLAAIASLLIERLDDIRKRLN